MKRKMNCKINIFHLYPDLMNLYGDWGNILTLVKRCEWRGIETKVVKVKINDRVDFNKADIIFMGGGQDRGQNLVSPDLTKRKKEIKKAAENGIVALTICGGFQLFGKYFKTKEGKKIPGIGIFDAYTVGSDQRMIGNVILKLRTPWPGRQNSESRTQNPEPRTDTLVGFENHSGKTYLSDKVSGRRNKELKIRPLGRVIKGYGNNSEDGFEGAVYKNFFGTYLHGSLLPKNPHFADILIEKALEHRYKKEIKLEELDDDLEIKAHKAALKRAYAAKTLHI